MNFDIKKFKWTREPASYTVSDNKIEIVTIPNTDLWQRTYYHFRNDNAPVFQMETDDKFFSFVVKTEFESKHRFDQCGIVMYLDSDVSYVNFAPNLKPDIKLSALLVVENSI